MDVSRADICRYLRRHWDAVRLATAARYMAELWEMDVEEVCERIMAAEKTYGPFRLETINCEFEFLAEVKDTPAYHVFGMAQRGELSPSSNERDLQTL